MQKPTPTVAVFLESYEVTNLAEQAFNFNKRANNPEFRAKSSGQVVIYSVSGANNLVPGAKSNEDEVNNLNLGANNINFGDNNPDF